MAVAIRPTIPGKAPGIVGEDPWEVQCQQCGHTFTHAKVSIAVLTSGIHFHPLPWTSGETDNPRMCRTCRLARGCRCWECESERRR